MDFKAKENIEHRLFAVKFYGVKIVKAFAMEQCT
jgi:hypothetical protein